MKGSETATQKNVEFLENGDILFQGKLLSSAEFTIGKVLCDLKMGSRDDGESNTTVASDTLSDLSQDDSPENDVVQFTHEIVPPKRRKHVNHTVLPPDDVRLTYVKRYFDAMNTGDAKIIKSMMLELAIPKMVVVVQKEDKDFHIARNIEIVGVEAYALSSEACYLSIPDFVMQPVSETIKLYANGESCIEMVIAINGVQVYEMKGLEVSKTEKVVLTSAEGNSSTTTCNSSSSSSADTSHVSATAAAAAAGATEADALADDLNKIVIATSESSDGARKDAVQFGVGNPLQTGGKAISYQTHMTWHLNTNKKIFLMVSKDTK